MPSEEKQLPGGTAPETASAGGRAELPPPHAPAGEETDRGLARHLKEYAAGPVYPFHMPGHKRRARQVEAELPWDMDITEIDGFDDLHDARGLLLQAQARPARLYGSDRAWFLVGGSTCGVLAAITAATCPGDTVLVARNCHKSVYHALELRRLRPLYLAPAQAQGLPFCGSVSPAGVAAALKRAPDAKAVILTSPTYEGILSDVGAIAALCHRQGIPLVVDEAHGAHLGLDGGSFGPSAAGLGADLVVQSLHKTLPALTQSALLHLNGGLVEPGRVDHALDMLETSSPSYLLMASIDSCLRYIEEQGESCFAAWRGRLDALEVRCRRLRHIRLYTARALQASPGFCWAKDPGKLLIGRGPGSWDGMTMARALRTKYKIEVEMAQPGYLLAMTSPMDTDEGFARLAQALEALDQEMEEEGPQAVGAVPLCPEVPLFLPQEEMALPMEEAQQRPWQAVDWGEAAGRVSAGYLWVYPPGIPWLAPGERIPLPCAQAAQRAEAEGVQLKKTRPLPPGQIAVLREDGESDGQ